MGLLNYISRMKSPKFTFKDHYGREQTMRATDIYNTIMQKSKKSDYNWIAPAIELVKLCKNPDFPREYAVEIEIAILNCFSSIESRVNRGGDKYVTKAGDARAVQYCYDELGKLIKTTDNEELKKTILSARTRYLKEMVSSAVNTTIRGDYLYCEAYSKLREEVVARNFTKFSLMEEEFNIFDMYEEISDETDEIFKQAYKNGMFKQAEEEATFRIVKMFDDIDDLIIPKKHTYYPSATFKGYHTKNDGQENPQPSSEEDVLGR